MPFKIADVEEQYKKDKNLKREDVKILMQWMQKQPHLPKATELQLALFLHSCNYRIEPAKKTIDSFFTIRSLCPEIYAVPREDVLKKNAQVGLFCALPEATPDGDRVFLGKLLDLNPDNYVYAEQINMGDLEMILNVHQQGIANGLIVVMDMDHFSFGHLTKMNPMIAKKFIHFVQEALPFRLKSIHIINAVPLIDKAIALLKPFMKKELLDLINIHTPPNETFYRVIPKRIMPKDFGGEAPTCEELRDQMEKNVLNNMDFLKWLETQKVDESKRIEKRDDINSVFGMEGSFKKLELD